MVFAIGLPLEPLVSPLVLHWHIGFPIGFQLANGGPTGAIGRTREPTLANGPGRQLPGSCPAAARLCAGLAVVEIENNENPLETTGAGGVHNGIVSVCVCVCVCVCVQFVWCVVCIEDSKSDGYKLSQKALEGGTVVKKKSGSACAHFRTEVDVLCILCCGCVVVVLVVGEFSNLTREPITCTWCGDPKGLVPWARSEGRECARCRGYCHWRSQDAADPKAAKQQFARDMLEPGRRKRYIEQDLPEYHKLADDNGGRAPSRKSKSQVEMGQEIYLQCFMFCCEVVFFVLFVHCTQHFKTGRRICCR